MNGVYTSESESEMLGAKTSTAQSFHLFVGAQVAATSSPKGLNPKLLTHKPQNNSCFIYLLEFKLMFVYGLMSTLHLRC